MDPASTEFYDAERKMYCLKGEGRELTPDEMVDYWAALVEKFPIVSIEDGMAEEDWDGWKKLTERIGGRVQLVGDDLFVTNKKRLAKGVDLSVANAILVKVNQIGTLTEAMDTMELAKRSSYTCVVSHRSGETEDSFIADLAVAVNAGQIEDWRAVPQRPHCQVQPAPAHRGRAGRLGRVPGTRRLFYNLS